MPTHNCERCGGALVPSPANPRRYWCNYCKMEFDASTVEKRSKTVQELLGEAKQSLLHNLRKNLYDAVTEENVSNAEVLQICAELKKLLPDDFAANFFRVAVGDDIRRLNRAIIEIDTEANYAYMDVVIPFLIRSMTLNDDYLLALNDLVERAFKKRDMKQYHHYATQVSEQAEKVWEGIYATNIPREVFVAYSSKDMPRVIELVEALEAEGFSCFVAARNLRHGAGAKDNYVSALQEAIDNCRVVVFVSSNHSRSYNCDALRVELAYIKKQDIAGAPIYRNCYADMPDKYKMPRVEYRFEDSARPTASDKIVQEFFHGYGWKNTVEDVVDRVTRLLFDTNWDTDTDTDTDTDGDDYEEELDGIPDEVPSILNAPVDSEGLEFELTDDGDAYVVTGIGTCTDTHLRIPNGYEDKPVVGIDDWAFQGNTDLVEVTLPSALIQIGDSAFEGCTGLTDIALPHSVLSIGESAFDGCTALTDITLPDGLASIGESAFDGCTGLTRVTVPVSVTSLGKWAFDCENLTAILYFGTAEEWSQLADPQLTGENVPAVYCGELAEYYVKATEENDADAQYRLAECFSLGQGGATRDEEEGDKWLQMAAEQGHSEARAFLGMILLESGDEESEEAGIELLRASVAQENSFGKFWFGMMRLSGDHEDLFEQTDPDGLELLRQSAEDGCVLAQVAIAEVYDWGDDDLGIEQSVEEAVEWYAAAAEQGSRSAMFAVAQMLEKGRGTERDYGIAVEYYLGAASEKDEDEPQTLITSLLEAMFELTVKDLIETYYSLGLCYEFGRGVDFDIAESTAWYRRAAERGHAGAQLRLGCWCEMTGYGSELDEAEAAKWYRKAAEQGNAEAQYRIGVLCATGRGEARNEAEAVAWYRKAAAQRHALAKEQLERLGYDETV